MRKKELAGNQNLFSKCVRKTTRSVSWGCGLYSPRGRQTVTSVSHGKRRDARRWAMSSTVMVEPIQEPDGRAIDEGKRGRKKMDDGEVLLEATDVAVRRSQEVEQE